MIVPSTRLLIVTGGIAVPAALAASLPGWAGIGYGIITLAAVVAAVDAFAARTRLRGISAQGADVTRLWKDRAGGVELTIQNDSRKEIALRIGLSFPDEIVAMEEELSTVLPSGVEFSRIAWQCTPNRRGR